jgi:phosphate uptake regulator
METRKIQQVGGGTYTVSLPKEWAAAADIEPGSVVALHTHIDGTLVVRTDEDECGTRPLVLSVTAADSPSLERALRAAYAAGIDAVELHADGGVDDAVRRRIERVTRQLTGVTVTETTGDGVRVRSLLDPEEVSITQSVRQLQFAALSAHRDATAAVTGPTALERPGNRDDQVDRIVALVDRYFQRGLDSLAVMDALGLTRPELFVRWVTARELERVADEAGHIATVANSLESPIGGDVADAFDDLAEDSRALVRDAVSVALGDADATPIRAVTTEADRVRCSAESLDRRLFEADDASYRLTRAVDSLSRTADSAVAIAQLALRSRLRAGCRSETPLDVSSAGRPVSRPEREPSR